MAFCRSLSGSKRCMLCLKAFARCQKSGGRVIWRRQSNQGDLFLEYQPKLDYRVDRFTGVEALVRWRHAEYGLIQPDEFIATAEEANLICRLTDWVAAAATSQAAVWDTAGVPLNIAINISARDLGNTHR